MDIEEDNGDTEIGNVGAQPTSLGSASGKILEAAQQLQEAISTFTLEQRRTHEDGVRAQCPMACV